MPDGPIAAPERPAPAQAGDGKRIAPLLPAVLLLVLTVFLFAPIGIYTGNFKEFTSLFHESALVFAAVSLALIAVLCAAGALALRGRKARAVAVSVIFALGFLAWFQGNILAWKYGVLDGKDIDWNGLFFYGILDSAIWIAVIVFAVVKAGFVSRASKPLSLILILVQLVSGGLAYARMPKDQSFKLAESDADTEFLFSDRLNVIVLVLDTFQSDIFQDVIRGYPDLKASFDGFTYFRNSLAASDGTIVSIPNILTGADYDNSVPYLDFVKKSFLDNSLPKTLKEYGFKTDLYPIFPYTVYQDFSGVDLSRKRLRDWRAFAREQAYIMDLALFRSSPHFLKQAIYNNQRWLVSGLMDPYSSEEAAAGPTEAFAPKKYRAEFGNAYKALGKNWDVKFITRMVPAAGVLEGTEVFKFYHLNGIHLQLVLNENLEYGWLPTKRANMVRQGAGIMKIAAIFLERLKSLGVYDNSLIFIVGDHGSGVADAGVNVSPLTQQFNKSGPYKGNFKTFKATGIPLILAKGLGAKGDLKASDAPVCLGDIPETVVEELGLDARFPGKSLFAVGEGEKRERIFRGFVGPQEDVEYLAPLWEYAVNGFSWNDESWRETGNVYYAKKK